MNRSDWEDMQRALDEARVIMRLVGVKTKHGPSQSGQRGDCDSGAFGCVKCAAEAWLREYGR